MSWLLSQSWRGKQSFFLFAAFRCFVIAVAFLGLIRFVTLIISSFVDIGCVVIVIIFVFVITIVTFGGA